MNQEELLTTLRPWLKAVATQFTRDPGAQQDLAQEGWIAAWKQAQDPNTPADQLLGWCKEAARWRIRRLMTGDRPTGAPVRAYGAAAGTDVALPSIDPAWLLLQNKHDDLEMAYHHGEIHQAISELSPKKQEYVYLRFFVGMNQPELTEWFGYKPFGLWTGPWGAKKKLAERLAHLKGENL